MCHDAPVLILAGGTGGHIFPGIAVAQALAAQNVPVIWLGSRLGLENRLVPEAGLRLETIAISGLRGKGVITLVMMPWRLLRAIWQARAVVKKYQPRAAISFGGFAAGPGGIATWLARIPLLVHEQNRIPGLTNRILAKLARRVLTGFPDSFNSGSVEWVGNPVRADIAAIPVPEQRFAFSRNEVRLLVIGGSQGARVLNTQVPVALAQLRHLSIEVRHQCGSKMVDTTRAAYDDQELQATVEPFIVDMAAAYAWADLVICRAGALTLAELCAAGVASILVPFPLAVDDHQTANARFLVASGAALLLSEAELNSTSLSALIKSLAISTEQRLHMARSARALAKPAAAARVAELCLETI